MEIFAWPIAVVALGVFFLLFFRKTIEERIKHLRSIGKTGVSLDLPAEQKSIERQADAAPADQTETLLKSFDSPALLQEERVLFTDLEARKLDSKSDTTKVLVRYLAKTRLLWMCEFVYRLIFGSQIAFLKHLNTVPGGISQVNAQAYYVRATEPNRDIFPESDAAAYFDFLVRQGLVISQNKFYLLSDFGREFLGWLVQAGVSELKSL